MSAKSSIGTKDEVMTTRTIPTAEQWAKGARFSPEGCPNPDSPKKGETYAEYRARVDKYVEETSFDIGDLGKHEWEVYCMGSGHFEGVNSNDLIYPKR